MSIDLGATEPVDPRPVDEVRSQLLELIEAGGEPYDRDIAFTYDDRLEYRISTVGIDVDPSDGTFRCVIGYPANSGMVASEDWYKITPDGKMSYVLVEEAYTFSELAKLEAYKEAYGDWHKCVSTLHQDTALNAEEEHVVIDDLMFKYQVLRSNFYRDTKQVKAPDLTVEEQIVHEDERLRAFVSAQNETRQAWINHLQSVRTRTTKESFESYRQAFMELLDTFLDQAMVHDDAKFRLARRSEDANEQFDQRIAEDATLQQSWQLLKLLDKCQDYSA